MKEWNIFDELTYRVTKAQMNRIIKKNNRIIEKYKKEGISIPQYDVSPKNEPVTEEINEDTVEDIFNEVISENTEEDDSPIIIFEDNDGEEVEEVSDEAPATEETNTDTIEETVEVVEEQTAEMADATVEESPVVEEPVDALVEEAEAHAETDEVVKEQMVEEAHAQVVEDPAEEVREEVVDYGSLVDVIRHSKINTESKKAFIESVYKQTQYPVDKIMVSIDDEAGTGDFTIRRNLSEDRLTDRLDWVRYTLSVVGYTGDEIAGFTIEDKGPVDGYVKTFTADSNKGYSIALFFSDTVTEVVSKKKKKEKKAAKRQVQIMWIYKISE